MFPLISEDKTFIVLHVRESETNVFTSHCVLSIKHEVNHSSPHFPLSPAPEHDDIIFYQVTSLPAPDVFWTAFLFVWGSLCTTDMITPSGWVTCVWENFEMSTHLRWPAWYNDTHQTSGGLCSYWGYDNTSIFLQGSTNSTCIAACVRGSACTCRHLQWFTCVCVFPFI